MREELKTRAQEAVGLAKEAGAADAFAWASRSREVEFSMRDGTLEQVKDATSRALSLRVWADGRSAKFDTTDLRPAHLRAFIAEAVALTRALEPDPHRVLPDPSLFGSATDLDLVDPGVRALDRDDRIALCEAQSALLVGQEGVVSSTTGTFDGHSVIAGASSNGFSGSYETTDLWLGSEVTMRDEGDARPAAWFWGGGHHRADAPAAERCASEALERARARLGATKGATARTTMIVDPSIGGSLVGRLLAPASGSSLQQGQSFWEAGPSVSDKLTIVDDPLIPRGLGSRPFDGEGLAARRLPILTAGRLETYYVDTYYGRKLGMAPTTGSASNRVLALGDKDLAALLAEAGEGIYVTGWLGGNSDPTTGDFSLGIRGHLVQGGRIGAPVGEMNVTGNLLELFGNLLAVGNDPWPYGATKSPTLVFGDVQFSGARASVP